VTRRRIPAVLAALAGLAVLAALTIGLPLLLYRLGGSPIPSHLPTLRQATAALTRRDNGTLFLAATRDISWLAWVMFTFAVLAETQAAIRGRPAPRLRIAGMQQPAAQLVALAAFLFSTPAAVTLAAAPALAAQTHPQTQTRPGHAASRAASARQPSHHRTVVVRPGDCLWTLAARYLGAGDRYTEIADLNLGRPMGDGQVFTNPDLIEPGWRLQLPAGHRSPGPDRGGGRHVHTGHPSRYQRFAGPHPAAAPRQPSLPQPDATRQASGAAAPSGAQHTSPAAGQHTSYLSACALAVLASGALAALARMRHQQRQRRRPGRRVRLPASTAAIRAEQDLRAAAATVPDYLHPLTLRAALRDLAGRLLQAGDALPGIAALHLVPGPPPGHAGAASGEATGNLEVLLTELPCAPPPGPWTVAPGRHGMCWQLALPAPTPERASQAHDPLPGLVTTGVTSQGGYLLADLENLRLTACSGRPDIVDQILTAIAAELSLSHLAESCHLILAGFSEIEHASGRHHETLSDALEDLDHHTAARRMQPGDGPDDFRMRRAADPEGDWALALLVSRVAPDAGQLARLLALTSRPGTAALTAQGPEEPATPARIDLTPEPGCPGGVTARISPLQITVHATPLDACSHEAIAALFAAAADQADCAASEPPYRGGRDPVWLPPPGVLYRTGPAADPDSRPEPDHYPEAGGHPAADVGQVSSEASQVSSEASSTTAERPARPELHIAVLGPLAVTGPAGPLLPPHATLMTALALSGPDGLTASALCAMLAADPARPKPVDALRQVLGHSRRVLGRAADGTEWIQHPDPSRYVLHSSATLDWAAFHDAAGRGMRAADAAALQSALSLVRGHPFADCCYWWLPATLIETMTAEITDAAELLATLELAANRAAAAADAARAGLAACPATESLWRALMRAEAARGNQPGVRAAWQACLDETGRLAPAAGLQEETVALYRELRDAPPEPASNGLAGVR
jgi:DNA-binding SARP family transcriptional activator